MRPLEGCVTAEPHPQALTPRPVKSALLASLVQPLPPENASCFLAGESGFASILMQTSPVSGCVFNGSREGVGMKEEALFTTR